MAQVWTPAKVDLLCELWEQRENTIPKISEALGISETAISARVKMLGLPARLKMSPPRQARRRPSTEFSHECFWGDNLTECEARWDAALNGRDFQDLPGLRGKSFARTSSPVLDSYIGCAAAMCEAF